MKIISYFRDDTLRAWGYLDVLFILLYSASSGLQGRIPFYSDIESALWTAKDHDLDIYILIAISWTAYGAIFFSSVLLIMRWPPARFFAYAQTPLRIYAFIPSISPLWLSTHLPSMHYSIYFILLGISETLKITSLQHYAKSYRLQGNE